MSQIPNLGKGGVEGSRPGMVFAVELFEIFLIDVGIDLGGADVRVPEHRLNEPEIRPPLQQMRGKGVAQGMRGEVLGDPGLEGIVPEELPKPMPAHPSPPVVQKEEGAFPAFAQQGPGLL